MSVSPNPVPWAKGVGVARPGVRLPPGENIRPAFPSSPGSWAGRHPQDGDVGFVFGVGKLTEQGRACSTLARPSAGAGVGIPGLGSLLSPFVFAPQHPQWE